MRRSIWNFWFIFGLVVTVIGVYMIVNQIVLNRRCTEQTQGLIVAGKMFEKEAAMMLTFKVNGESYRLPFSYSDKMSVGDTVTVVYNPSKINRYNCYISEDTSNTFKMGILCIVSGFLLMLAGYAVHRGWVTETRYL